MNTFCKSERLCNKILFEELLTSDFSFVSYPFRIIAKKSSQQDEFPARIAVSISKKRFKRAVKRNRLKRLTREAYRLNKVAYFENNQFSTLDILFVYLENTEWSYVKIEKAIRNSLHKITRHFGNASEHE